MIFTKLGDMVGLHTLERGETDVNTETNRDRKRDRKRAFKVFPVRIWCKFLKIQVSDDTRFLLNILEKNYLGRCLKRK